MKGYFKVCFFSLTLGMIACDAPTNKVTIGQFTAVDSASFTKVQWLDSIVDFGTITKGESRTVSFRLKNIGDKPLFMTNVKAACGCTVADYTKEAIAPGAEGVVTGEFDSNKSSIGEVQKNIFVTTNTSDGINQTLIFKGKIIANKADQ